MPVLARPDSRLSEGPFSNLISGFVSVSLPFPASALVIRLHRRWCDTFNLKMMGRRRRSPVESPDAICRNRWLDVWDISAWIGEF